MQSGLLEYQVITKVQKNTWNMMMFEAFLFGPYMEEDNPPQNLETGW